MNRRKLLCTNVSAETLDVVGGVGVWHLVRCCRNNLSEVPVDFYWDGAGTGDAFEDVDEVDQLIHDLSV